MIKNLKKFHTSVLFGKISLNKNLLYTYIYVCKIKKMSVKYALNIYLTKFLFIISIFIIIISLIYNNIYIISINVFYILMGNTVSFSMWVQLYVITWTLVFFTMACTHLLLLYFSTNKQPIEKIKKKSYIYSEVSIDNCYNKISLWCYEIIYTWLLGLYKVFVKKYIGYITFYLTNYLIVLYKRVYHFYRRLTIRFLIRKTYQLYKYKEKSLRALYCNYYLFIKKRYLGATVLKKKINKNLNIYTFVDNYIIDLDYFSNKQQKKPGNQYVTKQINSNFFNFKNKKTNTLRYSRFFNKTRFSRNRQICVNIVLFGLLINILFIFELYKLYNNIIINYLYINLHIILLVILQIIVSIKYSYYKLAFIQEEIYNFLLIVTSIIGSAKKKIKIMFKLFFLSTQYIFFYYIFLFIRATAPRYRVNQLVSLFWKYLIIYCFLLVYLLIFFVLIYF